MATSDLVGAAMSVLRPRDLANGNSAGGVAAALVTDQGHVYRGVCIDTRCGMGFCAEHSAVAAMVTAGESRIVSVVAVRAGVDEAHILPPCGRCREFMRQIDDANLDAQVVLGQGWTVPLRELLPHAWETSAATDRRR